MKSKFMLNNIKDLGALAAEKTAENVVISIDMDLIDENPSNEKIFNMGGIEELSDYINEHGFDQPIGLREKGDGRYEIVFGHRRFRAKRKSGSKRIDAIVRGYRDDIEVMETLIYSNLLGRNFGPMDYARAFRTLVDETLAARRERGEVLGDSNIYIAKKIGMSVSKVDRYLRLTKLIPPLQAKLERETGIVREYTNFIPLCNLDEAIQYEVNSQIDFLFDAFKTEYADKLQSGEMEMSDFKLDRALINKLIANATKKVKANEDESGNPDSEGTDSTREEVIRIANEKLRRKFFKNIKNFTNQWKDVSVTTEKLGEFNDKELEQLRTLRDELNNILDKTIE